MKRIVASPGRCRLPVQGPFHRLSRLAFASALLLGLVLLAPHPASADSNLPFTAEENADGARFVWYVLKRSGMAFDYVPAASFQESPSFRPIEHGLQGTGDVAWWPQMMAIYDANFARARELPEDVSLVTASGPRSLKTMEEELGPARFYRYKR